MKANAVVKIGLKICEYEPDGESCCHCGDAFFLPGAGFFLTVEGKRQESPFAVYCSSCIPDKLITR